MRRFFVLIVLLSCIMTAPTFAGKDKELLRCTAAAISSGGPRTTPVATNLDIVVERWSTEPERRKLLASVKEGQEKILDTVRDLRRVGYIRTPPSLGWDLHFAQSTPGKDGGSRVVIATDRPMNFWEVRNQSRTVDYPLTFAQLMLNKDGEGKGTLSVATKVITIANGKYVELENYDANIQLNDVKCQ
jgi:hypothetical protein